MYADTHCHLFDEYYDDLSLIIKEANNSGVTKMIVSGCDLASNMEVIKKIEKHSCLYGTIGFHPEFALDFNDSYYDFLKNNINNDKILAIGEIGLDYHYDNISKEKQKEIFIKQLELAILYNKPVVIHSRDATFDMLEILRKYKGKIKGVMHCYSGSVETALELINLGFYLGVGGIVTFKNAKEIIEVIKKVGLKYIVLETDCPYLTPEPYRGTKNKPMYISLIAKKVAEILDVLEDDVAKAVSVNVLNLFDI